MTTRASQGGGNGNSGEPGRYSFWNTKRSDQKTPTNTTGGAGLIQDGAGTLSSETMTKTPKHLNHQLQSYNCFEDLKSSERADTEIGKTSQSSSS